MQMGEVQAQLRAQQTQAAALQQALQTSQAQMTQVNLSSGCTNKTLIHHSINLCGNHPSHFAICNYFPTAV